MNARLVACGLLAALLACAAVAARAAPASRSSTPAASSPLPGLLLDAERRIALGGPVPKSTTRGPVTFVQVEVAVERAAGANYSDLAGSYVDPSTGAPWPTTRAFLSS